ncbi:MAG: hypothetical protein O3A78_05160 [Nitrospinae bacterium]|nr:hypothetical protein [Nitrospinota bacterium]MDA1109192.1 hypothetical protein [Nitrospinota bacterium]
MNIIPERKLQAGDLFQEEGCMDLEIAETNSITNKRLKKFQVAGYGFLGLSSIYIALAWGFMPPFFPEFPKAIFWPLVLALVLFLTKQVLNQRIRWVKTLAVLSGLRFLGSTGLILGGDYLPVVPYFLPCFILSFYLLGRAGWNWP